MRLAALATGFFVAACVGDVDGLNRRDRPKDAAVFPAPDAFSEADASSIDAATDRPDAAIVLDAGELPRCDVRFREVSLTAASNCVLNNSGQIGCWGRAHPPEEIIPPEGQFLSMSGGYHLRCAIRIDGQLACWGPNTIGQATPPSGRFIDVSAGEYHACGVREDGTLACWGVNDRGIWDFGQSRPPAGNYRRVAVGQYITCGLRSDGEIVCWGDPATDLNPAPRGPWIEVFAGLYHACARDREGRVDCWGGIDRLRPPPPVERMKTFAMGFHSLNDQHWCGLRFDDTILCGGTNSHHQTEPPPGVFTQVDVGGRHSCAIDPRADLICWGDNFDGQINPPPEDLFELPAECP